MPFPHCDADVLHAPQVCRYCDEHPAWQQARVDGGINFTGENDPAKLQDPATARRPVETINRWYGNVPVPEGAPVPTMWGLTLDDLAAADDAGQSPAAAKGVRRLWRRLFR